MDIRLVSALQACAFMTALSQSALGQTFPVKPMRIITSDVAGGAADTLLRLLNERLVPRLGQPIIVENRPGADGMIAMDQCARSPSDGHTLCLTAIALMSITPQLRKVAFDPLEDVAPVTPLVRVAGVVFVNPALSVTSVKDLIEAARGKPGALNYASFGNGSAAHMLFEWLKKETNMDMLHVPYQGGPPALLSVVSGTNHAGYFALTGAVPQIRGGKIRALAVHALVRSPLLPEVPTMREAGFDYPLYSWFGMVTPRQVSETLRTRIASEYAQVLGEPATTSAVENLGFQPYVSTPREFAQFLRADRENVARLIKLVQIKPD